MNERGALCVRHEHRAHQLDVYLYVTDRNSARFVCLVRKVSVFHICAHTAVGLNRIAQNKNRLL